MSERPVQLALVRQRYAHDGGAERFVARALDALQGTSVAVTLVTRQWSGAAPYSVLSCDPFYLGRLWRDWSFARCVCRAVKNRRFDIVQSHERLDCCDVYRAGDGVHREWLAQRERVLGPLARTAQCVNPYHRYVLGAERRLFANPSLKAVIANSSMVRAEIMAHFGLSPEKIRVIYSGVDVQSFHPDLAKYRRTVRERHGIPDDSILFLFVGSGFERKGVGRLLDALARLPASAHGLIVGRDKHFGRYQRQAVRLGVAGRVRFTGAQQDVRPFYGAADALVLPTLYDPFPNVALEALASGLPVFTSRKCGAAELIVAGENGDVCDALDIEALAGSLLRFIQLGDRMTMSRAARATVAHMTLDAMGKSLVSLYQELLTV